MPPWIASRPSNGASSPSCSPTWSVSRHCPSSSMPRTWRLSRTPISRRVRETIGRWGGRLEKFIGDAAMAVFGAERVHEDDATRAVHAGLALTHAIEQIGARLGLDEDTLRLRVGINTGEAVIAVGGTDDGSRHRRHGQHRGTPADSGAARARAGRQRHSPGGGRQRRARAARPIAPEGQGRARPGVAGYVDARRRITRRGDGLAACPNARSRGGAGGAPGSVRARGRRRGGALAGTRAARRGQVPTAARADRPTVRQPAGTGGAARPRARRRPIALRARRPPAA